MLITRALALVVLATLSALLVLGGSDSTRPSAAAVADMYGKLPLYFEANKGQAPEQVRYLTRTPGSTILFTQESAVIQLSRVENGAASTETQRADGPPPTSQSVLTMKLHGGNVPARVEGLNKSSGISNYFLGSDPRKWHSNIPLYGRVRYAGVYDGIDLVYYGNGRRLEYDFVVAPQSDATPIAIQFSGFDKMRVESSGDLVFETEAGDLRLQKPFAYQEHDNKRTEVSCNFDVLGNGHVAFRLGDYDHSRTLVIDPTLEYSTYFGGQTDVNFGHDIAVDSDGNMYLAGDMLGVDFPTKNPLQPSKKGVWDAFIAKMTPDGSALIFSTYLGGSVWDTPWGIGIDNQRNVFVAGATYSTNFPTVNASQSTRGGLTDAWVAKLNPSGSTLLYSTYLGGSNQDHGYEIAVRPTTGEAYVTGYTQSANFPKVAAYQTTLKGCSDAFVAKFSAAGARTYSSFLGGTGCDYGLSIALDNTANIYVVGHTTSTNFPTTASAFQTTNKGKKDAFVTKLNPAGAALVYSTYLGGAQDDLGNAIAVHSSGSAFITGYTSSTNFPTTPDVVQRTMSTAPDAFVARLAANGQSLMYSTYLGGRKDDYGYAIAVDATGNAYVTGQTFSQNFPTAGALQGVMSGPTSAVFRSGDGGVSWSSSDDALSATQVAAFSIDPINPAVIVAGTEVGVVRSADNGTTWTPTNLAVPLSVFARENSTDLFAAERGNVWGSIDGGASWSTIGSILSAAGVIKVLAVDPEDPTKLYAGTQTRGFYASIDGGVTWTEKTVGMGRRPVNALAIDPVNTQVLYAGTANNGVYTSTDGGTNWVTMNTGLPASAPVGSLAIDPTDSNVIYAVTKGCVYKSTDRAATWVRSGCFGAASVVVASSDPTEIYAGTGSGVYRSADAGLTWEPANEGIATAFVPAIAVNPTDPAIVLAGSSVTGDAFVTKLNPSGNDYIYSTYLGGLASDRGYGIAAGPTGKTYVIGTTSSPSFPTTPDAFQRAYRTTQAFISRISDTTGPCAFDVNPLSKVFLAGGGSFDAGIVSPTGCAWNAMPSPSWIKVTAGNPGAGLGSIRVTVASNSGGARNGNVTIQGKTITIQQAASGCAFTITPLTINTVKAASTKNVTVKAGAACPWAVDNPYAWITITSGATGTGNGTIALSISANPTITKRTAQLFVGGKTLTINQPGT